MAKNTILSIYEDNVRQIIAIAKQPVNTVQLIHRTLYPTQSNKFTVIELDEEQLVSIVNDNGLAKPYTLNLGTNNLIVSEKNLQFIINTDTSYISIDIAATSKVKDFFISVYMNFIKVQEDNNISMCNHKNNDGTLNIKIDGSIVSCNHCKETFRILCEDDNLDVLSSTNTLIDAINTIKITDSTLTNNDLLELGVLSSSIKSIPNKLYEALKKLDNL